MIQQLVDFFYIVGAPEEVRYCFILFFFSYWPFYFQEIEKLNVVGESINPDRIGSWINVSEKGGIDGGWCFTVSVFCCIRTLLCLKKQFQKKVSDQLGGGDQFCRERSCV